MSWDVGMALQLKSQSLLCLSPLVSFSAPAWCINNHTSSTSVAKLPSFPSVLTHLYSIEGQSVCSMVLSLYRSTVRGQRGACIHRVCGTAHGACMLTCDWEAISIEDMLLLFSDTSTKYQTLHRTNKIELKNLKIDVKYL